MKENKKDAAYSMTEKRLYRYRVLCRRIEEHKKDIEELAAMNFEALRHSSKSFVSLIRTGMRVDPHDAFEAQIGVLRAYISADEYEVRRVKRALRFIRDDPYYMIIECKYFRGMTEEATAKELSCSLSTVRRNRARLVNTLSDALYGMSAPTMEETAYKGMLKDPA